MRRAGIKRIAGSRGIHGFSRERRNLDRLSVAPDGTSSKSKLSNAEKQLDAAGAPPTPGRLPDWKGGK